MRIVIALLVGTACTADAPGQTSTNCTKALYDRCDDEHNCDSGLCAGFTDLVPVCTMTCTPGDMTCPDQNGNPVPCDPVGRCHPPVARDCTIVP